MQKRFQINIQEFFLAQKGLKEAVLQAVGQPPIPPNPPNTNTSADSSPPNPDEFGFYVSFRFDQSLQQVKGTNSWGLYLSKSAINSLANHLVMAGCSAKNAWEAAHEFVYRTVELEYLADCETIQFDHFEWLAGRNPAVFQYAWRELPRLRATGVAYATSKFFSDKTLEASLLRSAFNSQKNWKEQLAHFFVELYGSYFNGHVLWPNPIFSIEELVKTVKKLVGSSAPKKSPIGTALPVHYIP